MWLVQHSGFWDSYFHPKDNWAFVEPVTPWKGDGSYGLSPQKKLLAQLCSEIVYNFRTLAPQLSVVFVILSLISTYHTLLDNVQLDDNWNIHNFGEFLQKQISRLILVKTSVFPKQSCNFFSWILGPVFQLFEMILNSFLAHVLHKADPLSFVSLINW